MGKKITGTKGIDRGIESGVSFSHSLRKKPRTVASRPAAHSLPIEKLAADLFDRWNAALQTGNAKAVAQLYAEDAVLLPTISNLPRTSPQEIEDYFNLFLQRKPFGTIKQRYVKKGGNQLTDVGVYEFDVVSNGKKETVPARYTFVYEYRDNQWKIVHHHSSMMPEK